MPILGRLTISPASSTFTKSVRAKITSPDRKAIFRYTTDGSEPSEQSRRYNGPLVLRDTTPIKARAYKDGFAASPVATAKFTKN